MPNHEDFMNIAIEEALLAEKEGNYGIGAVAVKDGKVIATNHNQIISNNLSVFHHAEADLMKILDGMGYSLPNRLKEITIYSTLEPCVMCGGIMVQGGVGEIVVGARDPPFTYQWEHTPSGLARPNLLYIGEDLGFPNLASKCEEIFTRTRIQLDKQLGYVASGGVHDHQ